MTKLDLAFVFTLGGYALGGLLQAIETKDEPSLPFLGIGFLLMIATIVVSGVK